MKAHFLVHTPLQVASGSKRCESLTFRGMSISTKATENFAQNDFLASATVAAVYDRRRFLQHIQPGGHRPPLQKFCQGQDSNLHVFRHQILSLARLPIPPPWLVDFDCKFATCDCKDWGAGAIRLPTDRMPCSRFQLATLGETPSDCSVCVVRVPVMAR